MLPLMYSVQLFNNCKHFVRFNGNITSSFSVTVTLLYGYDMLFECVTEIQLFQTFFVSEMMKTVTII